MKPAAGRQASEHLAGPLDQSIPLSRQLWSQISQAEVGPNRQSSSPVCSGGGEFGRVLQIPPEASLLSRKSCSPHQVHLSVIHSPPPQAGIKEQTRSRQLPWKSNFFHFQRAWKSPARVPVTGHSPSPNTTSRECLPLPCTAKGRSFPVCFSPPASNTLAWVGLASLDSTVLSMRKRGARQNTRLKPHLPEAKGGPGYCFSPQHLLRSNFAMGNVQLQGQTQHRRRGLGKNPPGTAFHLGCSVCFNRAKLRHSRRLRAP